MIKVGITGQSGFIGTHLFNTLGLYKEEFERIPFQDDFFKSSDRLVKFVSECDVIVHLAAVNRHDDPKVIYDTNIRLVDQLILALDAAGSKPHLIFASSIQEDTDNLYGKSKLEGRNKLADWADKNKVPFTGLVIPNVFGPFGLPFYNSVVATFCHQLCYGQNSQIQNDKSIPLIYVNSLAETIISCIREKRNERKYAVPFEKEIKVSEILSLLNIFKNEYLEKNMIPLLSWEFEIALFNTFRSYISPGHYPVKLIKHGDNRGYLAVTMQEKTGGQSFYSITLPGITRGNHYHRNKIERFCVVKGKASIKIRKIGSGDITEYIVSGEEPTTIDMPIWHTHNLTNIGKEDLVALFWSHQIFDKTDNDTFFEEV